MVRSGGGGARPPDCIGGGGARPPDCIGMGCCARALQSPADDGSRERKGDDVPSRSPCQAHDRWFRSLRLFDPISSALFGPVERGVGALVERLGAVFVLEPDGDTEADGGRHDVLFEAKRRLLDDDPHLFGHFAHALDADFRRQNGEFLATDAREDVFAAELGAHDAGQVFEIESPARWPKVSFFCLK